MAEWCFRFKVSPLLNLVGNWKEFLAQEVPASEMEAVRYHELTGRLLGGEKFVAKIEKALGRTLHRQKPGPKQRTNN
jgi:putative transposase